MAVVEIAVSAEQLAQAFTQLNRQERRSFLETVFSEPDNQQLTAEMLQAAQAAMQRKLSPAKQRLLDSLLDKNNEGTLRPAERRRLEELTAEYGADLIEKARAQYLLKQTQP